MIATTPNVYSRTPLNPYPSVDGPSLWVMGGLWVMRGHFWCKMKIWFHKKVWVMRPSGVMRGSGYGLWEVWVKRGSTVFFTHTFRDEPIGLMWAAEPIIHIQDLTCTNNELLSVSPPPPFEKWFSREHSSFTYWKCFFRPTLTVSKKCFVVLLYIYV